MLQQRVILRELCTLEQCGGKCHEHTLASFHFFLNAWVSLGSMVGLWFPTWVRKMKKSWKIHEQNNTMQRKKFVYLVRIGQTGNCGKRCRIHLEALNGINVSNNWNTPNLSQGLLGNGGGSSWRHQLGCTLLRHGWSRAGLALWFRSLRQLFEKS